MALSVGDKLPNVTLSIMGEGGPETVELSSFTEGKKVVLFGLPGAFTGTCSTIHLPSFLRNVDALKAKGVEHIICVAVNDPFVMAAWDKDTGAGAAGITLLADPESAFTKSVGMDFSVPAIGFHDRSVRYALMAEDGVVKVLNDGEKPGECDISTGETMVASL